MSSELRAAAGIDSPRRGGNGHSDCTVCCLLLASVAWHDRHRGDSSPCGQSPMDFESIPLAAQAQCHPSPGHTAMLSRCPATGLQAGRAKQMSSPSPSPLGHSVTHRLVRPLCCGDVQQQGGSPSAGRWCRRALDGGGLHIDAEGIRAPAGRAQWISSPSP